MKSKHIKKSFYFFFFPFSFLLVTCTSTEPPPVTNTVTIAQIDTMLTEVELSVKLNNITVPAEVTLLRGNAPLFNFIMNRADTIVTDTTVIPNSSYKYKATAKSGSETFTSNEYTAVTMDTTSQNFTFEYFEFGDGYETTYLNDVWVFDENNIWAVGYLGNLQDSVDNPNIIRWNGSKWILPKYQWSSSGIYGIWAYDSSNIFFAVSGIIKYTNGKFSDENLTHLPWQNGQTIEKLWGSSLDNIWGVGRGGMIVHYNGSKWERIEFDTQWTFYEITGNKNTGIAYAIGGTAYDAIIVKLENQSAQLIYQKSTNSQNIGATSRTIIESDRALFWDASDLRQTAICKMNEKDYSIKIVASLDSHIGISQSAFSSPNDLYFVGEDWGVGKLVHFNGSRFTIFDLPQQLDNYGGVSSIRNFAATVGFSNNKAFLIRIRRI